MSRGSFKRPFSPTDISSLVAHWSGNGATAASMPNRSLDGTVGAMEQATGADQPEIYVMKNRVRAVRFDGDQTEDLKVTDVDSMRFLGPRGHWIWHVGLAGPMPATAYLGPNQWAEGGSAERINFVYTPGNERFAIEVAIDATTTAVNRFVISRSAMAGGGFLEVWYDGDAVANAAKCRCFFNRSEVTSLSITGTNPAGLQAGDGANIWLGSRNGASNGTWDLVHSYVFNDHVSGENLDRLEMFEAPAWYTDTSIQDGNSITRGVGLGTSYPEQMKAMLSPAVGIQNFGVSGHTTAQRRSAFAAGPHSFYRFGRLNTVVIHEVGNHLLGGATEAAALAEMIAYCQAATASGWRVVLCTTLPRLAGAGGWTADMQTASDNINTSFRANYATYAHSLVDLAADAQLSNPADTAYYSDGIHTTTAANKRVAQLVAQANTPIILSLAA